MLPKPQVLKRHMGHPNWASRVRHGVCVRFRIRILLTARSSWSQRNCRGVNHAAIPSASVGMTEKERKKKPEKERKERKQKKTKEKDRKRRKGTIYRAPTEEIPKFDA